VFLHSVAEGPANQSYGLQVAQLAGVPAAVIQIAKKRLVQLENQNIERGGQGDLFAPSAEPAIHYQPHPSLEMLKTINPDELTPKAALELLYQLRKLAQQD
jgi:DNA mismatch repair protein MutS